MQKKASRTKVQNRFSWQITLLPILFIIFTAGVFSVLDIIEIQQEKQKRIESVTQEYISEQKKMAKNRVMTAVELIRFQSARTVDLVRKRVKGRVDEAIQIANAFYAKYHAELPKQELKEQIKLILSSAVFDHPDGYFFAVDMNTEKIILHKLDQWVGYSMSEHKDARGNLPLTQQKNLLSRNDGAFNTIYFTKPTMPDKEFPKQLYVRYFKPFNWMIGTGEYLDDMEKRLQETVLKRLKTLYTGHDDYLIYKIEERNNADAISIGEIILSSNPDTRGHSQGPPPYQGGKGNVIRQKMLKTLRDQDEGFVTCCSSAPHPSSKHKHEIQKTAFFYYDKTWNWLISSGFYYDHLMEHLAQIQTDIEDKIDKEIRSSITITLLIAALMSGVFLFLSRRIARTISRYSTELQQAQKMESVGRLAGGVAHDFNNMLSVIIGYSDMALMKISESDSIYKHLVQIRTAAKRSAEVASQLLAFSRQQTIAPKALDINERVEQMLTMLRRLVGEDITLAWHPGSDVWPILMDDSQLNQIIMNLCINARDAIVDTGTISVETRNITLDNRYVIKHEYFSPGPYVMLSISDTGSGMDKQTMEKVFEPFFTTKETGKGTGLGLSTVYGILKQNNCFINVYSEPGRGTTFNIYFPKHNSEAVQEDSSDKISTQDLRGSETILLLEDEEAVLNMATLILQELGYTVMACNSPDEALRIAEEKENNIDLLITDVVMPGMNGRDVSEKLQVLNPGLKTLYMSGYTANVIAHRGVLGEAINFIQKPFSKHDLALKVREVFLN